MHEQQARDQEDERREPERERRHHAEREVDRRADRAVRGREQARGAQPALDRHERVPARPRPRHRPFARKACSSEAIKAPASPAAERARSAGAGARRRPSARRSRSGRAGAESMITRQGRLPSTTSSVLLSTLPDGRRAGIGITIASERASIASRTIRWPASPGRTFDDPARAPAGRGRPTGGPPRSPPGRSPRPRAAARRCRGAAAP